MGRQHGVPSILRRRDGGVPGSAVRLPVKPSLQRMRRIGVIVNPEKSDAGPLARRVIAAIRRAGRTPACDAASAALLGGRIQTTPSMADLAGSTDLILVFGGDGTMLRAAREIAGLPTPLLG